MPTANADVSETMHNRNSYPVRTTGLTMLNAQMLPGTIRIGPLDVRHGRVEALIIQRETSVKGGGGTRDAACQTGLHLQVNVRMRRSSQNAYSNRIASLSQLDGLRRIKYHRLQHLWKRNYYRVKHSTYTREHKILLL